MAERLGSLFQNVLTPTTLHKLGGIATTPQIETGLSPVDQFVLNFQTTLTPEEQAAALKFGMQLLMAPIDDETPL